VKRFAILVTPDGQWVIEDSAEFLAALGDLEPDYDAALFAVKNLGFIKFQIFDKSVIEIELHPQNVELPALLAVQQQLLSTRVQLFRIKYLEMSWKSEILCSSEAAVSRLSELCAPKFAPAPEAKFVVEPQEFSNLFETEENPLRLLAQKWRMSFGHFDPSVISFAIKHDLLSRLMIAGIEPRRPDPVFRFIGDGHANWLDNEYHFHAIGEKLENLPDKDYGAWISEFYKNVARTGKPRYDYVTAAIKRRPDTYYTRYERLLLPWKTPSDEILVTLSSRGIDPVSDPRSPGIPPGIGPESPVARKSARSP
jgi:hypothetical protein